MFGLFGFYLLVGDTPEKQGFFLDIFMKTDHLACPGFYWWFFFFGQCENKKEEGLRINEAKQRNGDRYLKFRE